MRPIFVTLILLSFAGAGVSQAAAQAQETQETCEVPGYMLAGESVLNRVAAAVKQSRSLKIVVLGTGSSLLAGPDGTASAYPARLEAALKKELPGVAVNVASFAKLGQTTGDMAANLQKILVDLKPNLVVWQAGTVDAMRGVDPDKFRADLDTGIETIQGRGADVILMNMQYSPRTESMIALSVYADDMRVVARDRDVPLFDRLAIMRYWYDMGVVDLYAGNRKSATAQRVHDCIGRALATMVIDAAQLREPERKPQ
jgi:lysophospholipase L1-like esterase